MIKITLPRVKESHISLKHLLYCQCEKQRHTQLQPAHSDPALLVDQPEFQCQESKQKYQDNHQNEMKQPEMFCEPTWSETHKWTEHTGTLRDTQWPNGPDEDGVYLDINGSTVASMLIESFKEPNDGWGWSPHQLNNKYPFHNKRAPPLCTCVQDDNSQHSHHYMLQTTTQKCSKGKQKSLS